jgi:uncharacterized membrane protein
MIFGQDFGGFKGQQKHFYISAVHVNLMIISWVITRVVKANVCTQFMYIPWLAQFLIKFPPPKILRESRYKMQGVRTFFRTI